MRAFVLQGRDAAMAVEWLHVRADVQGVLEEADALVVWLPGALPALPAGFAGTELIVPRGGAFGSGEHDSTKAALVLIHRGWSRPVSMADVGTGSGILALYAKVRGCEHIEACDIDEPSVLAARELLPEAMVHIGGAECLQPCALVVANMTGAELTGSLTAILSIWTREQDLILSGMRAPEVDALVASVPARVVDRETLGAFTAVRFTAN